MVDKAFRKALDAYVEDMGFEEETLLLDNHAYDKSIKGITEDGRLVYSYSRMIQEYMEDEKCSETDALEWLDYNTLRAIPYMGERAPIIIMDNRHAILERYGD